MGELQGEKEGENQSQSVHCLTPPLCAKSSHHQGGELGSKCWSKSQALTCTGVGIVAVAGAGVLGVAGVEAAGGWGLELGTGCVEVGGVTVV